MTRFDDFDRSLAGNITKVLFLTVNVSDLDRAVEFYERAYPVVRAETIEMDAQPMPGLGLPRGHHASAGRTGLLARYDDVVAAGGRPYGPPSPIEIAPGLTINSFGFRDPDGTTLEWIGPLDPATDGPPDSLSAHNANCRDLAASHAW